MTRKTLPSSDRLRELFSYDAETGILRWNVRRKGVNVDLVAGVRNPSSGYLVTRIDGQLFAVHRVIWKLVSGQDPTNQVDHIDLDRTNNRWANLRAASNSQNMMNTAASKANTSGAKGVSWDGVNKRWRVRIKLNQKNYCFGRYERFDDAAAVAAKARDQLHGVFARAA